MSIIQLTATQIRSLTGCPNCDGQEIKLTTIEVEHPLPKFRKQHFYVCEGCGYWTGILDKYSWYPPPLLTNRRHRNE